MKSFAKVILASAFCLAAGPLTAQTIKLGYTNGNVERKQGVRFGTSNQQGMSIRISAEKAQLLKGAKIVGIEYVHSTAQLSNLNFFITNQLGEKPLYTEAAGSTGTRWKKLNLTTPFTITGEEFFVGYTCETESESYRPHLFDLSNDLGNAVQWALFDDKWEDISNKGYGAANIRLLVEGAPTFADATIKPVATSGFYKVGEGYEFSGQLFNFGTETLHSFDLTCQIGESEPAVFHVENVEVAPQTTYDFAIPKYIPTTSGRSNFKMTVSNINGKADADNTDNLSEQTTRIYPEDTKKKILLEMFTGQACGNCPDGHKVLHNATAANHDQFIEVAHHAGYSPDAFTMKEDMEYVWLYNSNQTFAPGVTFNRAAYTDGQASVVLQANDANVVKVGVAGSLMTEPFLDVNLDNQFDASSRKGTLTVEVKTYFKPSENEHRLNVFLTQDSIISYQSGAGNQYVHNAVFRGSLTDVWGEVIALNEGETLTKTYEYTIPENIVSSQANKVPVPTNLQHMKLVAFVSDATPSPLTCVVHNAESIQVKDNTGTGIEDLTFTDYSLSVNQNEISINGAVASATVYNAAGIAVAQLLGTGRVNLSSGLYIVKMTGNNGKVATQKICIK